MEKIAGSVTTLTRAWDNAEPQSGNSRDSYKAGERRLCTGRLQNDFGNDSDPSLHCGVAEGARRVWDKDDEFKSARARRPKGQCRGNAHKGSEDVSYHCADSEAKGNDPDADDFDRRTPRQETLSPETIRRYGTLKGLLREIPRPWKAPIGGIRAPGTQIRSAGHEWTLRNRSAHDFEDPPAHSG